VTRRGPEYVLQTSTLVSELPERPSREVAGDRGGCSVVFVCKAVGASALHRLSHRVEARGRVVVGAVIGLLIVRRGAIDDVNAGLLPAAGEGDVPLLEG